MKKYIFLLIIVLSLTGCFLDPYKNTNQAEKAINEWFSYKTNEDDLGETRKKVENISSIKNVSCEYVENDNNKNYIYKCEIDYSPIGETVIPLSKNEKKSLYVAITYKDDRTYNYIIYNSSYTDNPWKNDKSLNYNK